MATWGKSTRQVILRVRLKLFQIRLWLLRHLGRFQARHPFVFEAGTWLVVALGAAFSWKPLNDLLIGTSTEEAFSGLQTVVLTVGGAMIGATAIVSSFVLFAMQVNVERLPYGLFRRFSSDSRLLSVFGLSFAIAIAGTSLSLIQDRSYATLMILAGLCAVLAVLRLLLLAYGRSLQLVSPIEQLELLADAADKKMRRVEKRIDLILPSQAEFVRASSEDDTAKQDVEPQEIDADAARFAVLFQSKGWDRELREAVAHCVAYARRAGEQGDLDVSGAALATVVRLNEIYVRVKGRTFHANNPFIDTGLSTDGFINNTLEELRRLNGLVLARKDERQAEQIFRTFLGLIRVYLAIQYPGVAPSKSHALLAGGYLEKAVQAAVPLNLIDTTMIGLGVVGEGARMLLTHGQVTEMTGLAKTIGMLGALGSIREDYRPLTLTAMEQLTDLTVTLLHTRSTEIRFAAGELRNSINLMVRVFLDVPDAPLTSNHSFYLGPYFSSTSLSSLRTKLTDLANALLDAQPDDEAAETIAENFEEWAEGLYSGLKELLLLAIEKRSHFAFDLIHWVTGISEILVTVANAPATHQHTREELKKHASWLFGTLSWVPRDPETVAWVEHLSFTETVFSFALMSAGRNFDDGYDDAWRLLFNWGLEGGRRETGWGTLEHSLIALVALSLHADRQRGDFLKEQLKSALAKPEAPDQEIRDRTARRLREKAEAVRQRDFELRSVERVLAQNDRDQTRALLHEIANILSPDTKDEPVRPFF